jgi:imidazolonepropionase-like amidohydrolase
VTRVRTYVRACTLSMTLIFASAATLAHSAAIALTGATVHTVSGPVLEHATVVFEGGRITAVGADLAPPADATVVPCTGKHVYPGLISANSILGLIEIGSVAGSNDYRETGTTNPNIRAEVEINPESEVIPVTRINGVTSALVIPRGGVLNGTSALIHLDGWTYEDMTVKAPVALHVQWPEMKIVHAFFETRSDEEQKKARDQAIENLRKAFDDARAYWTAHDAEGRSGIPRHDRDVKWEAMGKALRGEIPVMFHASSLAQIQAALHFADEEKLTHLVIVGGGDAWRIAPELKRRDVAVITGPMLALPDRDDAPYDDAFTLPARLQAAGVRYCISDGGLAPDERNSAMNTRNLAYHAAMAASFGLPKEEALKSVTLYPAQILGVADRLGSIETGKIADLIVTDGDPLEITTTIEQVYINGRAIPMTSHQIDLFHKYDARPRGSHARPR